MQPLSQPRLERLCHPERPSVSAPAPCPAAVDVPALWPVPSCPTPPRPGGVFPFTGPGTLLGQGHVPPLTLNALPPALGTRALPSFCCLPSPGASGAQVHG